VTVLAERFRRGRRLAVAMGAFALVTPVFADTFRLDDSGTLVTPPTATWDWLPGALRTGLSTLEMFLRVDVRIDTRRWAGRNGHIYMVLPADGDGPIQAEWTTQGRLLGGRLASGGRTLVYSGTIPGPTLEDTMRMRLTTDSRRLPAGAQRMAFHFEIDSP
jgi:hypothetical protein